MPSPSGTLPDGREGPLEICWFGGEMAHFEEDTSNRVLEILEDWNDFLKENTIRFKEPTP